MIDRTSSHDAGFTLTEMAIVLSVVGVLVGGLWNIIAGANQQSRDSAAASEQGQLIAAVKEFLLSPDGQNFMTFKADNTNCPATNCSTTPFPLPLPSSAAHAGGTGAACSGDANLSVMSAKSAATWCATMPPGIYGGTVNSYGQTYSIQILRDSTAAGSPPNSYSFMIRATGATIPDASGGRIATLIGGDGGFIYTNAVCTAAASPTVACGSYGGWTADVVGIYGFGGGAAGTIASRTYMSSQLNSLTDWLARVPMPGDTTAYTLNTMTTPEYLGGNPAGSFANELDMGTYNPLGMTTTGGSSINLQSGSLNFGYLPALSSGAATTGTMNMQGGTIYFNNGLAGTTTGGGSMDLQGGSIYLLQNPTTSTTGLTAGVINLQGGQIRSTVALSATNTNGFAGNDAILLDGAPGNTDAVITANQACTIGGYNPNYYTAGPPTPKGEWIIESTGITTVGGGTPCSFAISTSSLTSGGLISAFGFYAGTFVYNTGSDIRLKKDVHPLVGPLADIMRLNPVSFTYKQSGIKSMGVIAQELETVYPNLVSYGDKGMKYVNYDGLIAPLIGSVQELKKENDELRHELELQKANQEKLEEELHRKAPH